jgi:membrane-associated phospholipid phosphatase
MQRFAARGRRFVPIRWTMVVESLTRPYRVTLPMVVLVLLVPGYLVIAGLVSARVAHTPELPVDRLLPLEPGWALVYGALYLFLIILPVFVVREPSHLQRTVWAYLFVWATALVAFVAYPTTAPRPPGVEGQGFAVWGLRFLYSADPPYNCFPSLHVAHSFVSALTCYRAHRRLGIVATLCASLVALSTLFAKQHYVLDVVAGVLLAAAAYVLFLRHVSRDAIPEADRRLAPDFAWITAGIVAVMLAAFWVAYVFGGNRPVLFPERSVDDANARRATAVIRGAPQQHLLHSPGFVTSASHASVSELDGGISSHSALSNCCPGPCRVTLEVSRMPVGKSP